VAPALRLRWAAVSGRPRRGRLPGFEGFPYREYSEIFFGPDYKVLRGGSWATRPHAIRNTFRNWDYPIRRQLFVGFRCAK
jgi:iron(II)-dependent oxidoreductase